MDYHVSIYAKFTNAADAEAFLREHAISQSIPKGGPVFAYSQTDESSYFDELEDLKIAFRNLNKIRLGEGGTRQVGSDGMPIQS